MEIKLNKGEFLDNEVIRERKIKYVVTCGVARGENCDGETVGYFSCKKDALKCATERKEKELFYLNHKTYKLGERETIEIVVERIYNEDYYDTIKVITIHPDMKVVIE